MIIITDNYMMRVQRFFKVNFMLLGGITCIYAAKISSRIMQKTQYHCNRL